jgi:hypothetical protein
MSIVQAQSNTPWADTVRDMAGEALQKHYPGYWWAVQADEKTGMCDIRCMQLSGAYGYRLHFKKIFSPTQFQKRVMQAGGEILERYRQSRKGFHLDQYMNLPTDRFGRLIGDKSKAK